MRVVVRNLLLALCGVAAPLMAQRAMVRAVELERRGQYAEAAQSYRQALAEDSLNIAALAGLERVLTRTGQLESLVPYVEALTRADDVPVAVRSLEIRLWVALNRLDNAEGAALRWVAASPRDVTPYREWSRALVGRGEVQRARAVLERGRAALGGPPALAASIAPLAVTIGDWEGAAAEWRMAVEERSNLAGGAESSLGLVPPRERDRLVRFLVRDDHGAGSRLAANLLAAWGEPEQGWARLSAHLPDDRGEQAMWLSRFAERVKLDRTRPGRRAYGLALERLALAVPASESQRYRADAARAFSEAGDARAARRMLEQIAGEGGPNGVATTAQSTLIRLLVSEGKLDEADARFREWQPQLAADERAELLEVLVVAWIDRNRLDQAAAIVASDSTLSGWALRGWVALYRGALAEAVSSFQAAGPRAGLDATGRTQVLALIQPIAADSLPALGGALLDVQRGDTARGVKALKEVAARLPASGGRGGVLVYAADLETLLGRRADAEATYRRAFALADDRAAVPAAGLGLARLLARRGAEQEAREILEHVILTFPESAVVPQARRELDRVSGAVPGTR